MTTETSNARGEWPERYACNGPEGTFWTDDAALANKLIAAAFDRDEWTVTDTQNPTGAAPQPAAARGEWVLERLRGVLEHGKMGDKCLIAPDLVTAAIAALSAQQSPAEAQPVAWLVRWQHGRKRLGITIADSVAAENYYHWRNGGENNQPVELLPLYTAPPSAPVGVGAVKCPWDEGSPCVDPRPAGMVYPTKPAPRASGYLDSSGVEWNAWDAGQMEAYARAAYSDGWEAGYRAALAQQPAAVDEAAAIRAFEEHFQASSDDPYFEGELELWLTAWRKALAAHRQEPTT